MKPPRQLALLGLGALLLLALAACDTRPRWNVVLVTFDTTRADHIGDYGSGNYTPNLDALAEQGTRFAHALASVPITAPSHSTILTGKYPIAHGFRDNGLFTLGAEQETLAEVLSKDGYATAAAIASFPLLGRFGLDQGFDLYDDHITSESENFLGERVEQRSGIFFDARDAGRVNAAVLPWVEENADRPFFLWVHYFDPHQPYNPRPPYDQLFADDPYRAEIAFADEAYGTLERHLRDLGVWDNTVVVFVADHGEGLGEHKEATHSMLVYDTTLHVPLIIKAPGQQGGQVFEDSVGTVDIMPTVLDLLGLEAPNGTQGQSLAPAITGDGALEPRPIYAETLSPRLSHRWGELRSLVDGGHKYIFGPRPELFDLREDPRELRNLVTAEADRAEAMQRQLASFIRNNAADDLPQPSEIDEDTKQRLMALGYLSGAADLSAPIEERLNSDGAAPQDRVIDINLISVAKDLLFKQRPAAAKNVVEQLLAESPQSPFYRELLAACEIGLGNFDEVRRILDEIQDQHPDRRLLARHSLHAAQLLLAQDRPAEALQFAGRSLDLDPSAEARYAQARALRQTGADSEQYMAELQATLDLGPRFVVARVDLAIELIRQGDLALGESHLLQAMSDYPLYPRTFFNYGRLALDYGLQDEALRYFARAVELDPNYVKARHALITVLVDAGRIDAAREHLLELERSAPGSGELREAISLLEGVG